MNEKQDHNNVIECWNNYLSRLLQLQIDCIMVESQGVVPIYLKLKVDGLHTVLKTLQN